MLVVAILYAATLEIGTANRARDWDHAYETAKTMIEAMDVKVTPEIMEEIQERNYYYHEQGDTSWAVQIFEV